MGDLEVISILNPASADAEADEYESAAHVLHDRWLDIVLRRVAKAP